MNKSITGIIYKKEYKVKPVSHLKYSFSPSSEIHAKSSVIIDNRPWCSGDLSDKTILKIVENCNDNQSFIQNGAWSIVHFLNNKESLVLIRDIVGIHPLYYSQSSNCFAFSDSLHMLVQLLDSPLKLESQSLAEMLFFNKMDRSEKTLIQGVREVKQSQSVSFNWRDWKLESNTYLDTEANLPHLSYSDLVIKNRTQIQRFIEDDIVNYSSQSNAAFLSGGIDSSCLVQILAPKLTSKKLSFYTMTFEDASIDESKYAKIISQQFPSNDWIQLTVNSEEYKIDIENLHRVIEWPTLSSGTYNQYKLIQRCKEDGQKVIWDGLGADAIYGGHDYYRHELAAHYFKNLKIRALQELLGWKQSSKNEILNASKTLLKQSSWSSKWIFKLYMIYINELKLYNRDFLDRSLNVLEYGSKKPLKDQMRDDFFNGGIRHLSRFTNRISKDFDIKMKYPFAENVKWANHILESPYEYRFHKGASKAILRDSFKNELPKKILKRRDKKGLLSPNNQWIEEQKEHWIEYFGDHMSDVYDLQYLKDNYKVMWTISNKPENYRQFKHISFAIWRKVMKI